MAPMLAARRYRVECIYGCCRDRGAKSVLRRQRRRVEHRQWMAEAW